MGAGVGDGKIRRPIYNARKQFRRLRSSSSPFKASTLVVWFADTFAIARVITEDGMAPTSYALEGSLRALDLVLTQAYTLPIRFLDQMRSKLLTCASIFLAGAVTNAASSPYLLGLGAFHHYGYAKSPSLILTRVS
jgi:hypothetical protein